MNGRVYDPTLGRFLSVDPVFQFPTNGQSLNPYSYVLNNPLSLTDPSGYVPESCTNGNECPPPNKQPAGSVGSTGSHIASGKQGATEQKVAALGRATGINFSAASAIVGFKNGDVAVVGGKTKSDTNGEQNKSQGVAAALTSGKGQGTATSFTANEIAESVNKVFTHHTAENPNSDPETPMPDATRNALSKIVSTPIGEAIAAEAIKTSTTIDLDQIPTGSKFYKPDFAQQGKNSIIYTEDVQGYLSRPDIKPYAGEYAGVGLDVLLLHEIGHTDVASQAIGFPYSPGFSMQNEFDVVKHVENPYRAAIGAPPRTTYTGQPIPP